MRRWRVGDENDDLFRRASVQKDLRMTAARGEAHSGRTMTVIVPSCEGNKHMVDETFSVAPKNSAEWFEVEVPIRGCVFSLKHIQLAYSELDRINQRECERAIAELKKPAEQSDADWASRLADIKARAFKLTVSIIGGDDNVTKYGETSEIFDDTDLPLPIKKIFFTNENSYKNMAGGNLPPKRIPTLDRL